jgi:hypothetical protein
VWVCVVSDFLGLNFDVFFRSLRILCVCDVLGVKNCVCIVIFWVKLFVFFRSFRRFFFLVCVSNCFCFLRSLVICVWAWEREEG